MTYPRAVLVGRVVELGFFVDGKPVAKGRPRFRKQGNYVQTFTPEETVTWEQNVGWQVKQQLAELTVDGKLKGIDLPFEHRVGISLRFNFDKPKSYPKKTVHHLKKPDFDNLAKSLVDALQNVNVLKDDRIVTDAFICKRFSEPGHPQGVEVDLVAWLE